MEIELHSIKYRIDKSHVHGMFSLRYTMTHDEEKQFILKSRIRIYKWWTFKAYCETCREERFVAIEALDNTLTVEQVRDRLVCRHDRTRVRGLVMTHKTKALEMRL